MKRLCVVLALLGAQGAQAEEVFLTEDKAPVALFGEGAVGKPLRLTLDDAELRTLSLHLQKRVDQRDYAYVEVKDKSGAPLGVIIELEVIGQSLPIQFAVGVKPDGTVQDIQVMVYRESHGAEIEDRRFRAQFHGKTEADPLLLGKDIDAISGATISSASAAYATRKALALAAAIFARPHPAAPRP